MAKKSSIEKNNRRAQLAKQKAPARERLKSLARDRDAAPEDRFAAQLKIELKYVDGEPVIREISRVSKPGRRVYSKIGDLPRVYNGLGISILSTPRGVLSDNEARAQKVGGEVLCRVF